MQKGVGEGGGGGLNQAPVVQGMDSKIERINRYAVDKYCQLSPCEHPAITDTPITRTADKSQGRIC